MNEKRGKILVLIKILSCVAKGMIGNIGKDISPTHPPACSEVIETSLTKYCPKYVALVEKIGGSINYPRMVHRTINHPSLLLCEGKTLYIL